jgi:hypothetical protein
VTNQPRNIPASVHARLTNKARQNNTTVTKTLAQYGIERFIARLTQTKYGAEFILKGGQLFYAAHFPLRRPTRDIDFVSDKPHTPATIEAIFKEICEVPDETDGVIFDPASVRVQLIATEFQGVEVRLVGKLGNTHLPIQVDLAFSNIITPGIRPLDFPTLLQPEQLRLKAYPYATVIAEKLQILVSLAGLNSRLKDFYDLWLLAHHEAFQGAVVCQAITNTFTQRATRLPADIPYGLSDAFAIEKQSMWDALFQRYQLTPADNADLGAVLAELRSFLIPPLHAAATDTGFTAHWPPGGPWQA